MQNKTFPIVQQLNLNSTVMVADSQYRNYNNDKHPANFFAQLLSIAQDAKRIFHYSMSWTQSLYAHNRRNMEIKWTLDPSGAATEYTALMTPYVVHVGTPDGNPAGTAYGTAPVDGSYCADLQAALNHPTGNPPPGNLGIFSVFYDHNRRGIVIECSSPFKIDDDCTWLQRANNVHGFGVKQSDGVVRIPTPSTVTEYTVLFASNTPNLTPFRMVSVSSDELARHRVTPSFTNVPTSAFSSSEINVFPISSEFNGVYNTLSTPDDPTIINLDSSDRPQDVRIRVRGDTGEILTAGNVWPVVFMRSLGYTVTPSMLCTAARTLDYTRVLMVMYGSIVPNPKVFGADPWGIKDDVFMKQDDIVHLFAVQSGDS
jgi:hypothetical protein